MNNTIPYCSWPILSSCLRYRRVWRVTGSSCHPLVSVISRSKHSLPAGIFFGYTLTRIQTKVTLFSPDRSRANACRRMLTTLIASRDRRGRWSGGHPTKDYSIIQSPFLITISAKEARYRLAQPQYWGDSRPDRKQRDQSAHGTVPFHRGGGGDIGCTVVFFYMAYCRLGWN